MVKESFNTRRCLVLGCAMTIQRLLGTRLMMFMLFLCTLVISLYRYQTNGASTAEMEDCVASTARPHNYREYVAGDLIHDQECAK